MITIKDMDSLRGIMSFFQLFGSSCHLHGRDSPLCFGGLDPYNLDSGKEKIPIIPQKESYDIKLQTAHH